MIVVMACLCTLEVVCCVLAEPLESKGPGTFRGAPGECGGPEDTEPDVISPVARSGKGPEFCEAIRVGPPDCWPDDFFIESLCLLRGPELDFCLFKFPVPDAETRPGEWLDRLPEFGVIGPE